MFVAISYTGDMGVTIIVYDGLFVICRLAPGDELPTWSAESDFLSVTRSPEELSIVCSQHLLPRDVQCSRNWRMMRIEGVLDLQMTGVLSGLLSPLAKEDVSVFVLSTFDTDYFMVPEQMLEQASEILRAEGHRVIGGHLAY